MRRIGGHIGVTSESGSGTTFDLMFPSVEPVLASHLLWSAFSLSCASLLTAEPLSFEHSEAGKEINVMLVERVLPIAVKRLNTIQTGALLTDAAKLLCETPHKALLVVCNPDGVMVGVISKTDIIRQIAHSEGSRWTTAAEAVMTRDVTYCHPSDSLHDVLSKMKERGFVHVPIVNQESKPVGVINARDAFEVLLGDVAHEVSFLRDYITGIGYH